MPCFPKRFQKMSTKLERHGSVHSVAKKYQNAPIAYMFNFKIFLGWYSVPLLPANFPTYPKAARGRKGWKQHRWKKERSGFLTWVIDLNKLWYWQYNLKQSRHHKNVFVFNFAYTITGSLSMVDKCITPRRSPPKQIVGCHDPYNAVIGLFVVILHSLHRRQVNIIDALVRCRASYWFVPSSPYAQPDTVSHSAAFPSDYSRAANRQRQVLAQQRTWPHCSVILHVIEWLRIPVTVSQPAHLDHCTAV